MVSLIQIQTTNIRFILISNPKKDKAHFRELSERCGIPFYVSPACLPACQPARTQPQVRSHTSSPFFRTTLVTTTLTSIRSGQRTSLRCKTKAFSLQTTTRTGIGTWCGHGMCTRLTRAVAIHNLPLCLRPPSPPLLIYIVC